MTSPIFLSYSSKDHAIAETICSALENRGLTCWMASRDIGPGENFQVSIMRAIRGAGMMLLVFSGNSNNSDEVKKEIALAGQHKLLVVPVRVEDVVPGEAFEYELATRQWIDLFENWEQAIERLATQIRSVIQPASAQGAAAADALPIQPHEILETAQHAIMASKAAAKPARRSSVLPIVLTVVVLVALSAGGVWWWKTQALAKDNDAWAASEQQNSVVGYQGYLQAEPDGRHVTEANLRIDELDWKTAAGQNTVAGYQVYKQMEPQGRHVADADAGIAALNAAAKAAADKAAADKAAADKAAADQAATKAQQAMVSPQPPAANAQQAGAAPASPQDDADFKKALQLHTGAEYRNFLATHANSPHALEIRRRLASCQFIRTGTPLFQRLHPLVGEERCQ
jgi:hypothetical protein